MGLPEIILLVFILVLGILCLSDKDNKPGSIRQSQADKDIARIRQMKEWDRFDDSTRTDRRD